MRTLRRSRRIEWKQNIVAASQSAKARAAMESGLLERCVDDCAVKFVTFHVLNFVMYTEALKAIDYLEEKGQLRNEVKRTWNIADSKWRSYQVTLHSFFDADGEEWYLLQDYQSSAFESAEKELFSLEICCSNVMLQKGFANAHPLSIIASSLKIWDMIKSTWKKYFDRYGEMCGADLSIDYKFAFLDSFAYQLKCLFDILSKGEEKVDFDDDSSCRNAVLVLSRKLLDENMHDDAAKKALAYSSRWADKVSDNKEEGINEENIE